MVWEVLVLKADVKWKWSNKKRKNVNVHLKAVCLQIYSMAKYMFQPQNLEILEIGSILKEKGHFLALWL